MPIVKFIKENIEVEVEKSISLLKAIRKAELNIETPCNAMGFCGKCKVIARGDLSLPSDEEVKMIDQEKNERLSCMALVLGDVEVEFIQNEKTLSSVSSGYSIDVKVDSHVKIFKQEDKYDVFLKDVLLESSSYEKNILGVAIDIGTTGISYYLINLADGSIVSRLSSLNPQTQYGGDVLTRITYCMENSGGAKMLQKVIISEINKSIGLLLSDVFAKEDVYHITVAANTTMNHLLMGINPEKMTRYPYNPVFLSLDDMKANDIGIEVNKEAIVSVIPSASAYVGGDIVAGIMASDFKNCHDSLFIDIGTNGEMAVMSGGKIVATSTAAGPALEGMNIECGCRAQKGAIESFSIDQDCNISFKTIGDAKAVGICGSGLIDIAGAMVDSKLLMKSGRWSKNLDDRLKDRLIDKRFYINDDVYISQKDIRQIQLAKGAIAAGVLLMLEELDMDIGMISKVYIAGAFGYHINAHNILSIGLIPKGFRGEIEFLGNTSLEGARLALINKEAYENLYVIKEEMQVLELSMKKNFQDVFVAELGF